MLLQEDNLFRKLPPLWDIKAKVNLHRLSEIYFRYYLLHIRNKYPIQMHLQTLEIIGFKESVKKSNT